MFLNTKYAFIYIYFFSNIISNLFAIRLLSLAVTLLMTTTQKFGTLHTTWNS